MDKQENFPECISNETFPQSKYNGVYLKNEFESFVQVRTNCFQQQNCKSEIAVESSECTSNENCLQQKTTTETFQQLETCGNLQQSNFQQACDESTVLIQSECDNELTQELECKTNDKLHQQEFKSNMNLEAEYKANKALNKPEHETNEALNRPEHETNEALQQPECKTKEDMDPKYETNEAFQPECKTKEVVDPKYETNEAFQPECKTKEGVDPKYATSKGFQRECEIDEVVFQPKYETSDSHSQSENETYMQQECENSDMLLQPECETNPTETPIQPQYKTKEVFLNSKCVTNDFDLKSEYGTDEMYMEQECEISDPLLQPECKTNEAFEQHKCITASVTKETCMQIQNGSSESLQLPECEANPTYMQPECEANYATHMQPECEVSQAEPECETDEVSLQPECDMDRVMYDEYGFARVDAKNDTIERQHDYPQSGLSESQQHALSKFLDQISGNIDNKSLGKLQSHIRRGIPPHLRGKLWKAVLGTNKLQASSKFNYMLNVQLLRQQLVDLNISEYCSSKLGADCLDDDNMEYYDKAHIPLTVIRQISVDVDRTFPLHRRFRGTGMEGVEGRAALFRVLAVYARYNPAVGYCQGMSYIVGMLLMNLEEIDAFWVMVVLFEKAKYLSGYFNSSMGRIQRHAEVFKCLLKQRKPLLYRHLENVGVHPLMFITPWFMCLYTSLPCWDTVLSIWDHLIMEGVTVIFRVGLALLDIVEEKIMSTSDMSYILPSLLHVPVEYAKSDTLLPVLWQTTVHRWEIDSIQAIVDEDIEKKKQGRKRALAADEAGQKSKRVKTNATEGSLFKRIVNMFTPNSQKQTGPPGNTRSQIASMKKRKEHHRRYPGHVVTRRQAQLKEHDDVASTERRLGSVSISPPPNEDKVEKQGVGERVTNNNLLNKGSHSKSKDVTSSPKSSRRGLHGFQFANGVRRSPRISSSDYRSRLGKKSLESWQNPFNTPSNRKLISSSAKVQHAFKIFHTPTPLRNNQGCRLQPSPFFTSPEIEMSTITASKQLKDQ